MDSPAAAPQAPANAPSAFPLKPILWLLGSMTSLALGTSLAKQIFPIVGAQGTTALRLLFSALVLILFGRPWRHRMPRHDWWVGGAHLPFPGLGHVVPYGKKSYHWVRGEFSPLP